MFVLLRTRNRDREVDAYRRLKLWVIRANSASISGGKKLLNIAIF